MPGHLLESAASVKSLIAGRNYFDARLTLLAYDRQRACGLIGRLGSRRNSGLQNLPDAFTSAASLLEPREDLHDFVVSADRSDASEVHAGCPRRRLTAFFDSIDRADGPILSSR